MHTPTTTDPQLLPNARQPRYFVVCSETASRSTTAPRTSSSALSNTCATRLQVNTPTVVLFPFNVHVFWLDIFCITVNISLVVVPLKLQINTHTQTAPSKRDGYNNSISHNAPKYQLVVLPSQIHEGDAFQPAKRELKFVKPTFGVSHGFHMSLREVL